MTETAVGIALFIICIFMLVCGAASFGVVWLGIDIRRRLKNIEELAEKKR